MTEERRRTAKIFSGPFSVVAHSVLLGSVLDLCSVTTYSIAKPKGIKETCFGGFSTDDSRLREADGKVIRFSP